MSILRTVLARVRALWRSAHADRDLDDELRAYVDAQAASYERRGLAPAEAKRAALMRSKASSRSRSVCGTCASDPRSRRLAGHVERCSADRQRAGHVLKCLVQRQRQSTVLGLAGL
jgi:hypothetical protein